MRRAGRLLPLLVLAAAAASPAVAAPAVGRYASELCVALRPQPPSCGPVDAEVFRGNRVLVRIADLVYRLKLNSSQAEVELTHNAMVIDEFVAPYEWAGDDVLQFDDLDKKTRYELRLRERR